MNLTLGALPIVGGNRAELLADYEGSIAAMAAEIDTAAEYVHVEFYILVLDDTTRVFFDALRRARERGVLVRVLVDHLSSIMFPNRRETFGALDEMGAEWHAMLPLRPAPGAPELAARVRDLLPELARGSGTRRTVARIAVVGSGTPR